MEKGSLFHWVKEITKFEFLDKVTIIFALHQLLLFSFNRLKLSARDDALLMVKSLALSSLNKVKHNIDLEQIIQKCNQLLSTEDGTLMFNENDVIMINHLKGLTEKLMSKEIKQDRYEYLVESLIIDVDHYVQTNNLAWTNSFLLNLFK
ncbi:hypothetical protein ACOZ9X_05795 [Fictibacillus nanhaiensis]